MIITKDDSLVWKCNISELVSDHYTISFHVEYIISILSKKLITYRKVTQIDLNAFMSDIKSNFKQDSYIPQIDILNTSLEIIPNEHAPLKSLLITEKNNNYLYNDTCDNSKITPRKQEHAYRLNKSYTNLYNFTDNPNS